MANLPKGYQEVEYIESTGTQYIDTGVVLTNKYITEVKYQKVRVGATYGIPIFGARKTTSQNSYTATFRVDGINFGVGWDTATTNTTKGADTNTHIYKMDKGQAYLDGELILSLGNKTFTTPYSCLLFGIKGARANVETIYTDGDVKIFYFKIWDSINELVRDFVPCYRKSDNVAGMYDLVNNQFYTNSGSGDDFIVGPNVSSVELTQLKKHYIAVGDGSILPREYQEVEYLESDGSQYINTGVIPTTETKAEFTAQVLSHKDKSFEGIFGSRTANNTNAFCFGISTGNVFFSQFDNATRTGAFNNYDLNKHSYVMSKDGLYQDDNLITTYTDIKTISSTKSIFIMGTNSEDSVGVVSTSQRSYGTKIYESNIITREMIPCYRKSDNLAGMYDLQNTGKNLVGIFEYVGNTLSASNGQLSANASYSTTEYVAVKPNTIYTWRRYSPVDGTIARLCEYTDNKTYTNKNTLINITKAGAGQVTFTTGSTTAYIRLSKRNTDTQIQLEEGSVATAYEPYPFYVNAGTGEFIVGAEVDTQKLVELKSMYIGVRKAERRLPIGYQEVEYIQKTDGIPYINTNIIPNRNHTYIIDFERDGTYTYLFGSDIDWQSGGIHVGQSGDRLRIDNFISTYSEMQYPGYSPAIGERLLMTKYPTRVTIEKDGAKIIDTILNIGNVDVAYPIVLFTISHNGSILTGDSYPQHFKIYNFKIMEGDVEILNLIPCYRKSDNTAGMYDLVEGKFYQNASWGGQFNLGPDVETETTIKLHKHYIAIGPNELVEI